MSQGVQQLIRARVFELRVEDVVNLDLEGALEAVLEEMQLVTDDSDDSDDREIWEEISCLDLDDPYPMLDPVWADGLSL